MVAGALVVKLPAYFGGLTQATGRTVQVTAKGVTPFAISSTEVANGQFTVHGAELTGAFFWEVKAVRKDVAALVPEPLK